MTDAEFWALIRRKAADMEPRLAREFLRGMDRLRAILSPAEMERLIRTASVDRLLAETLDDATLREAFAGLREELQRTMRESLIWHFKRLPGAGGIAFDVLNPRVLDAIRDLDSRVMRTLSDSIRETVREHVTRALVEGINPRTVARGIRPSVGLAPNHWTAVENFRRELLAGDRAALRRALGRGVITRPDGSRITRAGHAGGFGISEKELARLDRMLGKEPLTLKQVDRLVDAYRNRLEAWNAEANARSASLDAMKRGQRLSWEDAIERGVVERIYLWRRRQAVGGAAGDGRNRPEHLAIHGEERQFDQPYSNGEIVPGDKSFACRCGERFFIRRPAAQAA